MLFPLIGIATGLGIFYYNALQKAAHRMNMPPQQLKAEQAQAGKQKPIVEDYIEQRRNSNQYILYSRLHKQPLSVHTLLKKQDVRPPQQRSDSAKDGELAQAIDQKVTQLSQILNLPSLSQQADSEDEEFPAFNRNEGLFKNLFQKYAHQLFEANKCESVELIEGPIFSKDSQYYEKDENGDKKKLWNVARSTLRISPSGEYLTDRFFAIVICNSNTKNHLNGFTMRKSNQNTFKMTNYLTNLLKIEEQTGLTFNVSGEPLTLIDFENINKERKYADFE